MSQTKETTKYVTQTFHIFIDENSSSFLKKTWFVISDTFTD